MMLDKILEQTNQLSQKELRRLNKYINSKLHPAVVYKQKPSKCGCKKCKEEGIGHGMYWYAYFTYEGKTRCIYVGKQKREINPIEELNKVRTDKMKCNLCLKEKKLQRKSHVIPEFMHKSLFDEHHKLYKMDIHNPSKHNRPSSGEYDQYILCKDCDRTIIDKNYESYAANIFNQETNVLIENKKTKDKLPLTYLSNIDYKRFKLFLLSILWRASISKREMFKEVNLGPYEETLREMILSGNPQEPNDFPSMIIAMRGEADWTKEFITQFKKTKTQKIATYSVIIEGFLIIYYIGKNLEGPPSIQNYVINKSNEMIIPHIPKGKEEFFVRKYLGY